MITDIEELFIKTFIDKRIAGRMIYELNSAKKREDGLRRFAHTTDKIINRKRLVKTDRKLTVADMLAFIGEHNKSELCYTIVGHYELEGKETTIRNALEAADNWPGHSAIFVVPNVAIIIEEQSYGPPARYLLAAK
jgi:hypothetical protein